MFIRTRWAYPHVILEVTVLPVFVVMELVKVIITSDLCSCDNFEAAVDCASGYCANKTSVQMGKWDLYMTQERTQTAFLVFVTRVLTHV